MFQRTRHWRKRQASARLAFETLEDRALLTNWDSGEPNNTYGGGHAGDVPIGATEEILHFHFGPQWNILPSGSLKGYLVEFSST
jgi:hypothetical protein